MRALNSIPLVTPTHFFWPGAGDLDGIVGSWRKRLRTVFQLARVTNGHPHRFRDRFATELLEVGIPIERVSRLLGHQSVRITEKHYAPWTESRQRQIEEDLRRAWEHDPVVPLEQDPAPVLHGENKTIN